MESSSFIIDAANFDISKNCYFTFPESIVEETENCHQCLKADFSYNYFTEIPKEVKYFVFLQHLDISYNCLKSSKNLPFLHYLTHLDLSHNEIPSVEHICTITTLKVLNVSYNKIPCIPEDISNLKLLTEVNFEGNRIKEIHPSFMELKKLEIVNFRQNRLMALPNSINQLKNLRFLDISFNNISKLDFDFRAFEELVNLNISNNPMTFPPSYMYFLGAVHLKSYLKNSAKQASQNSRDSPAHVKSSIKERPAIEYSNTAKSRPIFTEEEQLSNIKDLLECLTGLKLPDPEYLLEYLSDGYLLCSLIENYGYDRNSQQMTNDMSAMSSLFSDNRNISIFITYCATYLPKGSIICEKHKLIKGLRDRDVILTIQAFLAHLLEINDA